MEEEIFGPVVTAYVYEVASNDSQNFVISTG